jgi:predicted  nucleic acid-binding Zn-ribbon protein
MEQQLWLEIAEFVFIAGSAVALISGQLVFAAVPLTLALLLSILNRRRAQQELRYLTRSATSQAHQANQVIQSIHQQVQALPAINNQLNALNQQFNQRPERQGVEQLEREVTQLTEQMHGVSSRLDNLGTFPEADLNGMGEVITYINSQLDTLTSRFDNLPTPQEVDLTGVEQAIADITDQLNTLTLRSQQEVDLTGVEQVIADINSQLNTLTLRFDNLPTSSEVNLTAIEPAIAQIHSQLDTLNQQFHQRPEAQALEHLESEISVFTEQLNAVFLHLDNLSSPKDVDLTRVEQSITDMNGQLDAFAEQLNNLQIPFEVDLTGVEQSITHINDRLEILSQQFNQRPETQALTQLEHVIPQFQEQLNAVTVRLDKTSTSTPTEVDQSGVEAAIADIKGQLDTLNEQFNHRSETQAIAQLEQAIPQFQEQLNAVTVRLDNTSTPQAVDLSGVEAAIVDLKSQVYSLNQQFNHRSETQAIAQLEQAIPQLQEQLNALTLRLDHAPAPQEVDLSSVEQAIAQITDQLDNLNQRPETQAIQQFEQVIPQLQEQLNALTLRLDHAPTPQEVDLSGLEQVIEHIAGELDNLNQQFHQRPETQTLQELEQVIPQLQEQLNALTLPRDNVSTPQEVDLTGVEQAIEHIAGQLDNLNQQFHQRPEITALEQIESVIPQLREQLNAVTLRLDNLSTPQTVDLSSAQQLLTDIFVQPDALTVAPDSLLTPTEVEPSQEEQAIAQITIEPDALTVAPDHQIATLEPDLPDLTDEDPATAEIKGHLNTLNKKFNAQPTTQAIKHLERALSYLKEQLNAIAVDLANLHASNGVNLTQIEQAIPDIYSQLDALNQQFKARPETQAIEQLDTTIAQVRVQLKALALQIHNSPNPSKDELKEREKAITDVNFQIDAVAFCLENIPAPIEFDLSGVEQAITQVNSQLKGFHPQSNSQPETQVIQQLEQAIEQLKKQLNDVALFLENLPSSLDFDDFDFSGGGEDSSISDYQW